MTNDTMSTDLATVLREIAISVEMKQSTIESRKIDRIIEKILKKARKAALKGKFSVTYWWADYTAWANIYNLKEFYKIKDIKPSPLVTKLLDMKFGVSASSYTHEAAGFFGFYKIIVSWKDENTDVA